MVHLTELAERLGEALLAQGEQVSCAESCTGGGIAEAITRVAGSSAWFEAGFVTYSNRQKTAQLSVPEVLFAEHGAVSQAVVEAMARGAQRRSGARYAVAVSGIAGPGGGTPQKPVGTVWMAWESPEAVEVKRFTFAGDRLAIKRQSVREAMAGVLALAARPDGGGGPNGL